MGRKTVSGIMLTLLISGMLTLAFNIQLIKAEPRTIITPDDCPTLQETSPLSVTVSTDKPCYLPGEIVRIYGNLTFYGSPVQDGLVGLEVDNPNSHLMVVRTLQTGPIYPPGNITILGVVPCNEWCFPKNSFSRGSHAYFNVTLRNSGTEWEDVTITVNAFDANMVPLPPVASLWNVSIPPGIWPHVFLGQIYIPNWASTGYATAYVSALTNYPIFGGFPHCPEKPATFQIADGAEGSSLETQNSHTKSLTQNGGNYSLTFRLSPQAELGTCARVYVSSGYQGQQANNDTSFAVTSSPSEYTLAIYSSPTGVHFMVDGVSRTTPWSGTYNECTSVSLVMPETYDGTHAQWSHWLEDGDPNRIKAVAMNTNVTLTAVFTLPVGGVYIPVDKLSLLAPYIGLTILLAVAVVTVGYVKKRKIELK